MKILMVTGFFNFDLQYQENLMADSFADKGHEVFVITGNQSNIFGFYQNQKSDQDPELTIESKNRISVYRLPDLININGKLRLYKRFDEVLNSISPDAIVLHDISEHFFSLTRYLCKYPGVKVVMDYHCDYSNSCKNAISKYLLHRFIRRLILLPQISRIERFFPVTPSAAFFLEENYGITRTRMEILPLGSNHKLINKAKLVGKKALRKRIGIPEEATLIFTGGKFDRKKKLEVLVEAFNRLEMQSVWMVICGGFYKDDKEYEKIIRIMISSNPRILFVGWLQGEALYEHIYASDIGVFPASQSILWQDCIASGLALIVGDTGGQSIEYLNLKNNIFTLHRDQISVENIRSKIIALVENPLLLKNVQCAAMEVGESELNWEKLGDRVLKFLTN